MLVLDIGLLGLAFFTGPVFYLMRALNDDTEETVRKIASARAFCKRAGLRPKLSQKVIAHLEYVHVVRKLEFDEERLLKELSEPLREEVQDQRCENVRSFLKEDVFAKEARKVFGTDILSSENSEKFIRLLSMKL